MAPNLFGTSATLFLETLEQNVSTEKTAREEANTQNLLVQKSQNQPPKYKWKIVWRNVIAFVYLHIGALYGLYLFFVATKFLTILNGIILAVISALGITAGAHRLWAHRTYKAKLPLRIFLMILQTVSFQNHIYEWVRDHRVHHKFTDSDADPHNSRRGFFFSHMGWLLVRKHPDVIIKGSTIDMSDLESDPVVVWQKRLYLIIMPICCFFIPTWIPCYFWDERPMYAWYTTLFRYTLSLHLTWLVNSAAHMYGMKPYDKTISPTDNVKVALGAMGEGWHNYHHVFPWDYKAAELGNYKTNLTTGFIDMFAKIGWAHDLKTVPVDVVTKRATRTGDGTRCPTEASPHEHSHENALWGWGDKDMQPEDMKEIEIINKTD